jgi:transposase
LRLCTGVHNRRNSLFAGSDTGARHWAVLASLIQACKLNEVEPFAWLKDVLERTVSGAATTSDLDALLPWAWKPADSVNP